MNKMDYSPGYDFKHYQKGIGEGVNKLGGNRGHINSDATDASGNPRDPIGAALHDTLHFAGYPDGYVGGDSDGKGGRADCKMATTASDMTAIFSPTAWSATASS